MIKLVVFISDSALPFAFWTAFAASARRASYATCNFYTHVPDDVVSNLAIVSASTLGSNRCGSTPVPWVVARYRPSEVLLVHTYERPVRGEASYWIGLSPNIFQSIYVPIESSSSS